MAARRKGVVCRTMVHFLQLQIFNQNNLSLISRGHLEAPYLVYVGDDLSVRGVLQCLSVDLDDFVADLQVRPVRR